MIHRIGIAVVTILVVLVLNFVIIHLAPGDPVRILSGMDNPSEEVMEALRVKYGLDKPLSVQLFNYLAGLLRGDLGYSISYNLPVAKLISEKIGPTLLLTFSSAVIGLILGTASAIFSSRKRVGWIDTVLSFLSYVLYSMPSFWLGLILILLFAVNLGVFPTSGIVSLREPQIGIMYYLNILRHSFLPVTCLALINFPVYYRITHSSISSVENENFIKLFRATGMDESKIFGKYISRNAILPTITTFGLQIGYAITGATLVETVFAWPGMGRLLINAVFRRDYPLLMGIYLMMSVSVAIAMIVVDVLYAVLDPRIRYT